MGFRSTFTTDQIHQQRWPDWFAEKYGDFVNLGEVLSAKIEAKTYYTFKNLETDIQKAIHWHGKPPLDRVVLVWLHECGGITRVEIYQDRILYNQPETWRITNTIEHEYCYGCSDVGKMRG